MKAVPKDSVPFNGESLYSTLARSETGEDMFYNSTSSEWKGFPTHNDKTNTIVGFLESLLTAVKREPGCGSYTKYQNTSFPDL